MGANPSPISTLHYVNAKAVAFNQSKKPLLPAGDPFLGAFPVEREARPQGMAKIENR
jgi:hypothetical protein